MKLCKDCKHYIEKVDEDEDLCGHPKANLGGVRSVHHYRCSAMRAGICGHDPKLFEPKDAA